MPGWTRHIGTAAALPLENVDTDQIIPARFMSTPRHEGYQTFLFYDLSRDDQGTARPDFPLAKAQGASVLVTRRNFGCGSSREAAVYALTDAGFRVIIAPSFGDIFAANAVNNGVLPAIVTAEEAETLMETTAPRGVVVEVDLDTCLIKAGQHRIPFTIEDIWRTKIRNGWNDIDLTQQSTAEINRFRKRRSDTAPWVWPSENTARGKR